MSIIKGHNIRLQRFVGDGSLELIPLQDTHLPYLYKWNNDPEVVYWADSGNFDVCTEEDVCGIYSYVSKNAYCFLMVYDGVPVGDCWLQKMNLDNISRLHPGEKVYRIDMTIGEKDYWGNGIGSSALALLCEYAFSKEKIDVLYCIACDYNYRSRRTAERCGFTEVGKMPVTDSSRADFEYLYMMNKEMFLANGVSR